MYRKQIIGHKKVRLELRGMEIFDVKQKRNKNHYSPKHPMELKQSDED